jgi:ornithine cyclodeaminase/alanine dehydrogenase-like protein (mu-crystallin family)
VDDQRFGALAPFLVPGRAIAAREPKAASLPARAGVIDTAFQTLGIKTERIGNAQRHEFSRYQCVDAVKQIARGYRDVRAEAEGVALI